MMTRSEYVQVCSQCTNRKFDPHLGIVCGLTDKIADFQSICPSYIRDADLKWRRPMPPVYPVDKAASRRHILIGTFMVVFGLFGVIAGDGLGSFGVLIAGIFEFINGLSKD